MRPVVSTTWLAIGLVWGLSFLMPARVSHAQNVWTHLNDRKTDALPRPTDPGAQTPFDLEEHRLIELRRITLGLWHPDDPAGDLFEGVFRGDAQFVRLDLMVDGLVNPPGSADPFAFDPFRYGPHPIYGFVEVDMDADVWTGGELDAPQYRYLGNVARFGGNVQRPAFWDRAAVDGSAFDGDFLTPPFVERHGEEFHLVLLGWQFDHTDISEVAGDGDGTFDEGETWNISGPFFHRAHGYEEFSSVEGGSQPGEYAPLCDLQFRHDLIEGVTFVSLVFPLTNVGAGLMREEDPEPLNRDPTDQASVLEALEDLQLSALFLEFFPTGRPEEDIIMGWAERDPADYLDPTEWSVTALLGTSYTQPHPAGVFFVWTDAYPNVIRGDVDGSGGWSGRDAELIAEHIESHDGADGIMDGEVKILDFATGFSIYDMNYDGVVDELDAAWSGTRGDTDHDGDVDIADFASLQACFESGARAGQPFCTAIDLTDDDRVDLLDHGLFAGLLTGPVDH